MEFRVSSSSLLNSKAERASMLEKPFRAVAPNHEHVADPGYRVDLLTMTFDSGNLRGCAALSLSLLFWRWWGQSGVRLPMTLRIKADGRGRQRELPAQLNSLTKRKASRSARTCLRRWTAGAGIHLQQAEAEVDRLRTKLYRGKEIELHVPDRRKGGKRRRPQSSAPPIDLYARPAGQARRTFDESEALRRALVADRMYAENQLAPIGRSDVCLQEKSKKIVTSIWRGSSQTKRRLWRQTFRRRRAVCGAPSRLPTTAQAAPHDTLSLSGVV